MDKLKQRSLEDIRKARESLLSIKKSELTFQAISNWYSQWVPYLQRVDRLIGIPVHSNYVFITQGYTRETDVEVLNDVREQIVALLNPVMANLDQQQTQVVKSVLDTSMPKVKDTKLYILLQEFNAIKDIAPNHAAICFRTILMLILQERAKREKPQSRLATRNDLQLSSCIDDAVQEHIFSKDDERRLTSFVRGGNKDTFDFVDHRPGADNLVTKEELSDTVNLLNFLLPSIID